jgi:hypothetical protein
MSKPIQEKCECPACKKGVITGHKVFDQIMKDLASNPEEKTTYPLLEKSPPHDSPEFIDYLRENNVVIFENDAWIIIENCKYHTPNNPWHTAFSKFNYTISINSFFLNPLPSEYDDWEWLKKAKSKQTVKRFHIHLIQK